MDFGRLTDGELLLLLLALLYLSESFLWLPRGALAFITQGRLRAQRVRRGQLFPTDAGALLAVAPWPQTAALLCQQWPLSLAPEGVFAYVAQSLDVHQRPRQGQRYLRWEQIETVQAVDRDVLVNGEPLVRVCSADLARFICDALKKLRTVPANRREVEIDRLLAQLTDAAAIETRIERFAQHKWRVTWPSVTMCVAVLLAGPILLWIPPYYPYALYVRLAVIILFLLSWLAAVRGYFRAVRRMREDEPRWTQKRYGWMICLSPAVAMRGVQLVARDLVSRYHPLAIAGVVCTPAERERLARQVLLDLRHPMLPGCPTDDADAQATERWFRARLQTRLEQVVRAWDTPLESLLAEPEREGADAQAYCPRCNAQFAQTAEQCDACGGLALLAWTRPA